MKRNANVIRAFKGYCLAVIIITCLIGRAAIINGQTSVSNCTIDVSKPGAHVAPICRGQQIEEFNYQFQGGLYAQLINNPSFEELKNPIKNWILIKSGNSEGVLSTQTSSQTKMLNSKQEHCIKLQVTSVASGSVGLANGGYWGIKLENNTSYKVSFWAKCGADFSGTIRAVLASESGKVYAQSGDFKPAPEWNHFTCDLLTSGVSEITGNNRFVLNVSTLGEVYFDVVTVMPPTWKNRPNGLRPDLAEKLDALKLKYIQFPGGCTAESYTMDTCWNWKNSIGPIELRPGDTRNRWGYKNDLYFGLDEYLQLCEDLGAEPVYTTSAGISETREWGPYGVCPIDKMKPIIDDILDLLQYCNGSANTKWGAKRAANGHPKPYNIKYVEIGNENAHNSTLDDYNARYPLIYNAIKASFPDINIMYNGTGGNELSRTYGNSVDFTDEHFYRGDLTDLYNKYDSIDKACKKICVAEYASSVKGNGGDVIGNFGDALSDAVFMLGCEKNSEHMWWTGYGNYAGLVGHGNFGPCIVWNDAVSSFATPSYYMQKMLFTDNQGSYVLPFTQNTAGCYWSVSIDNESGHNDLLLKVANISSKAESVKIALKGVSKVDRKGHFTILKGLPDDENSLTKPAQIVPSAGSFDADSTFTYLFPAYSVSVLRIRL
jgi:alpha-L-arabinofuranosidase